MSEEEDAIDRMSEDQVRAMAGALRLAVEYVMHSASCDRLTALHLVMSALAYTGHKWSRGDGASLEPSDN